MPWVADLHIHSHFSMATSKECNPKNLHRWAGLKGVSLVGSGDFTHPGWRAELRDNLVPAESGFYRLKDPGDPEISGGPEVRFVVSGELSTIYKKNGRVRKVHHLIVLPSLEAADRISSKLEELGMNIRSDGRPILGLDSHHLLELVLEACPELIFIPAHIWTPHFSVFGSNSGFDDILECYEDLTQYIFALETGLSSDPAMNWRWSALDRFTLVSNSDAHNPTNLAREANLLNGEFSYQGLKNALQDKKSAGFAGTLEFFPEEGKYHYDGHRNCEVCLKPEETIVRAGVCPVCGRKVTVGVLHRVAELADRPEGYKPEGIFPYESLVPLREIIGSAINCGSTSQKVERLYFDLLRNCGPELTILREIPLSRIAKIGGVLVAEGIRRLRVGEVSVQPGYDGAYGIISVLREDDRKALMGQAALFEPDTVVEVKQGPLLGSIMQEIATQLGALSIEPKSAPRGQRSQLSPEQLEIIHTDQPIAVVIAGPGAGKTRTLVERIAYLIRELKVNPAEITGVTFTNKAAAELKQRLAALFNGDKRINRVNLGTFHSIAWRILHENPQGIPCKLLDEFEARELIEEVLRQNRIPMTAREAALIISLVKNKYLWEAELAIPSKVVDLYQAYQESLRLYQRLDFDDVLIKAVDLWEEGPDWLGPVRSKFNYLLVDEFQDINLVQYKLVKLWARKNQRLMVIGDPNQSIYGFRGASANFFSKLVDDQDYPKAVSFHLGQNYRSSSLLVNAANTLIPLLYRQNVSASDGKEPVILQLEAVDERIAARAVVDEIGDLVGGTSMLSAHGQGGRKRDHPVNHTESYSFSDIAILYRTGKQAVALEQALMIAGLPYRVVGPTGTLEAATVRDFLAFFRYLKSPQDLFLLRTNLRQPRWGLKNKEVIEAINLLKVSSTTVPNMQLLDHLLNINMGEETLNKLRQFYGVAQYYTAQMERNAAEIIDDWILRMDPIETDELEKLKKICENYRSFDELFQSLPLAAEADIFRKGSRTNGTETITLSTIHAAKGLEFPVVFITGVEEGLIPYGTEPDPDTVNEEQRLFYVAVTRAKRRLYLVNSQFRARFGEQT
ncbi:MAG TPA: hypothetical protein DDW65_15330, partial [Firmicutes bacterium]|nr:hypothetical protein [Bacillota bacterium]